MARTPSCVGVVLCLQPRPTRSPWAGHCVVPSGDVGPSATPVTRSMSASGEKNALPFARHDRAESELGLEATGQCRTGVGLAVHHVDGVWWLLGR